MQRYRIQRNGQVLTKRTITPTVLHLAALMALRHSLAAPAENQVIELEAMFSDDEWIDE